VRSIYRANESATFISKIFTSLDVIVVDSPARGGPGPPPFGGSPFIWKLMRDYFCFVDFYREVSTTKGEFKLITCKGNFLRKPAICFMVKQNAVIHPIFPPFEVNISGNEVGDMIPEDQSFSLFDCSLDSLNVSAFDFDRDVGVSNVCLHVRSIAKALMHATILIKKNYAPVRNSC